MQPRAQLVFDGVRFTVPAQCGTARPDQLQGTSLEALCELAGRECYDSLGRGRNSIDYHTHILQVGHLSVYEHGNFTVEIRGSSLKDIALVLLNRPGVFVRQTPEVTDVLRVTVNLRACLEWDKWTPALNFLESVNSIAYTLLVGTAASLAPKVIRDFRPRVDYGTVRDLVRPCIPAHNEERWVTLRLTGSRGLSHEQVRHGDRTAISQRSTRYVDEAESDWCLHPLIHAHMVGDLPAIERFIGESRSAYRFAVEKLEPKLVEEGVDRVTARKQARGAARGLLGNALGTSMIFSASVAQWRRMIEMRLSAAADGEIRQLYGHVLTALRESSHAECFSDMLTAPSPDGLGVVLASD